jgi:hypothetical protein
MWNDIADHFWLQHGIRYRDCRKGVEVTKTEIVSTRHDMDIALCDDL